jgi:hypothetical protein
MDLKQLDTKTASNEGRECVIKHPDTGLDTDIKINLAGIDSDLFQEMNDDLKREIREKLKRNKEFELTPDEERDRDYKRMARATLGWSGIQEDGKDLAFSYDNALRVYRDFPIIFRQVLAFVGGEGNFLPQFKKSSSKASKRS